MEQPIRMVPLDTWMQAHKPAPWLYVVEMDYMAARTRDEVHNHEAYEYWRYYVSAATEVEARAKVEHHVRTNSPYRGAQIRRVWRTEALIW